MKLIEKLGQSIKELSSSNGTFLKEAESFLNDEDLVKFAIALNQAASILTEASSLLNGKEGLTEEDVGELGILASELDKSGDPILQKQASVLDEILLTIGSDPKAQGAFKKAQEDEIERLRIKYRDTNHDEYTKGREQSHKELNVNDAIKAIDAKVKKYRPMESALSTRYSPDMPGVSLVRVGEGIWQCPITKKIYDFKAGYTTAKGNVVPGSDVSNQTQQLGFRAPEHSNFSTREEILNRS
jgi:hypothetical protein